MNFKKSLILKVTFALPIRRLGLELIKKKRGGVMVKQVYENSPAHKKNVKKGMSLLDINGVSVANEKLGVSDVQRIIKEAIENEDYNPQSVLKLTFQKQIRAMSPKRKTLVLPTVFSSEADIGVELINKRSGGVIVKHVHRGSPAENQGVKRGMSLEKIESTHVGKENVENVMNRVQNHRKNNNVLKLKFTRALSQKRLNGVKIEGLNQGRKIQIVCKCNETLGIELQPKKRGGLIVKRVFDNSPAIKGGVRQGMTLLSVNGKRLKESVPADALLRWVEQENKLTENTRFVFNRQVVVFDEEKKRLARKRKFGNRVDTDSLAGSEKLKFDVLKSRKNKFIVTYHQGETTEIGIVLVPKKKEGQLLMVKSVTSELARQKGIRRGMTLLRVNQSSVHGEKILHISTTIKMSIQHQKTTELEFERAPSISRDINDLALDKVVSQYNGVYVTVTIDDIMKKKRIGIEFAPAENRQGGLIVKDVMPYSKAYGNAKRGMRLVTFDGEGAQTWSVHDLETKLKSFLDIHRNDEGEAKLTLRFKRFISLSSMSPRAKRRSIERLIAHENANTIDVTFSKNTPSIGIRFQNRKQGGVVVSSVLEGSQASANGKVRKGMILLSVDGQDVSASTTTQIIALVGRNMKSAVPSNLSFSFRKLASNNSFSSLELKEKIKKMVAVHLSPTIKISLNQHENLGIELIPKKSLGVMISVVHEDSVPERYRGVLKRGMSLLAINGISVVYSGLNNVLQHISTIRAKHELELIFRKPPKKRITVAMKKRHIERRRSIMAMFKPIEKEDTSLQRRIAEQVVSVAVTRTLRKLSAQQITTRCLDESRRHSYARGIVQKALISFLTQRHKSPPPNFPTSFGLWKPTIRENHVPMDREESETITKDLKPAEDDVSVKEVMVQQASAPPRIVAKNESFDPKQYMLKRHSVEQRETYQILSREKNHRTIRKRKNRYITKTDGERWWLEKRSQAEWLAELEDLDEERRIHAEQERQTKEALNQVVVEPSFRVNDYSQLNTDLRHKIPVLTVMSRPQISRIKRLPKICNREVKLLQEFLGENATSESKRSGFYFSLKNTKSKTRNRPATAGATIGKVMDDGVSNSRPKSATPAFLSPSGRHSPKRKSPKGTKRPHTAKTPKKSVFVSNRMETRSNGHGCNSGSSRRRSLQRPSSAKSLPQRATDRPISASSSSSVNTNRTNVFDNRPSTASSRRSFNSEDSASDFEGFDSEHMRVIPKRNIFQGVKTPPRPHTANLTSRRKKDPVKNGGRPRTAAVKRSARPPRPPRTFSKTTSDVVSPSPSMRGNSGIERPRSAKHVRFHTSPKKRPSSARVHLKTEDGFKHSMFIGNDVMQQDKEQHEAEKYRKQAERRPQSADFLSPKKTRFVPQRPKTAIGIRENVEKIKEELEQSKEHHLALKNKRMEAMRDGLKFIPRQSLHGLESLIAVTFSQAVKLLERTYERVYMTRLTWGLRKWRAFVEMVEKEELLNATLLLQRGFRRYIFRRELAIRIQLRREQDKREKHIHNKRVCASLIIQAFFRGFYARNKMGYKAIKMWPSANAAATKLQTIYRIRNSKNFLILMKTNHIRQLQAAQDIQRCYRGFLGRQIGKLKRKIKAAELLLLQRQLEARDRAHFFRMIGAAKKISEWWRCRLMLFRTRTLIKLHKRKMAVRIQRFGRQLLSHKRILRLRIIRKKHDKLVFTSAAKIQGMYRRWKARDLLSEMLDNKSVSDEMIVRRRRRRKLWAKYMKYTGLFAGIYMVKETNKRINPWAYGRHYWAAVTAQTAIRKWLAIRYVNRKRNRTVKERRKYRHRCAGDIQRCWRGKLYGRRPYRKLKNRWAAVTLQRYYRGSICRYKLKLNWAVTLLQKLWRGELQVRKFRDTKLTMKRFKNIRHYHAHKIQTFFLKILCRRKRLQMLSLRRALEDERVAGRTQYFATLRYLIDEFMLKHLQSEKRGVIVEIYNTYCKAPGQLRGVNFKKMMVGCNRLQIRGFRAHELDIIFSKFKRRNMDFMSYSDHGFGGGFVKCLFHMANFRFPKCTDYRNSKGEHAQLLKFVNECFLSSKAFRRISSNAQHVAESNMKKIAIKVQTAFRGSPSFLERLKVQAKLEKERAIRIKLCNVSARIIQTHFRGYLCRKNQNLKIRNIFTKYSFTEIVTIDDNYGKLGNFYCSVKFRGEHVVLNLGRENFGFTSTSFPNCFKNTSGGRNEKFILSSLRKWCEENKVSPTFVKMPIEKTTYDIGCRKRLFDIAKQYDVPCYSITDPSLHPPADHPNHYRVKSVYWFDKRTKARLWVKPPILKYIGDVPAVTIPETRNNYNPKCSFCIKWRIHEKDNDRHLASKRCIQCDEVFCNFCFEKAHMFSGKKHKYEHLQTCDVCHYQIGTRKCFACPEAHRLQCDTCFADLHEKTRGVMLDFRQSFPIGGARYGDGAHKWAAIVLPCEECMKVSAQWECDICGVFCHTCLNKIHRTGNRSRHAVQSISSYYTVGKHLRKEDQISKARKAENEKRLLALRQLREKKMKEWVASKLQAIWRAKLERRNLHKIQKAIRMKKRREWSRAFKEQMLRNTATYRVLNGAGMAPMLKSDPQAVKKVKHMQVLGQNSLGQIMNASVAKIRRGMKADVLLPGVVEIAYETNVAWTSEDLTSHLKHGESIRIGTWTTKVDSKGRIFNSKRLPLHDFWDRKNADSLPIYRLLSIGELREKYNYVKKTAPQEQKVEEVIDDGEAKRRAQLLKDAKYLGETSLWEVITDDETGNVYYFNKLSKETQWEKPKCIVKEEEERAEQLAKIKMENARKRKKRAASRGGTMGRRERLKKGRAKIQREEEEEEKAREEANLEAMLARTS
jgi:C-terminal processing protease CtpA/Prc